MVAALLGTMVRPTVSTVASSRQYAVFTRIALGRSAEHSIPSVCVGEIAVRDGCITAIGATGAVQGSGATEIDADGKLVTPGWVDIHSVR